MNGTRMTQAQAKGLATRKAKADARFRIVQAASARGATIDEAAQAAGIGKTGVQSMLWTRLGTTAWPIRTDPL